jgi:uncharacterized protein
MDFDRLTVALLVLRDDAPVLESEAEAALQDAHMAYLAQLHADGYLVAAGPLLGGAEEPLRGLSLCASVRSEHVSSRKLTRRCARVATR